jgi:hypothetical protein
MRCEQFYDRIAEEMGDAVFDPTKMLPLRLRELSESLTTYEKHLFLWDILMNSTPKYRKATASRLRKIVAEANSRTPSPNLHYISPKAQQPIKHPLPLEEDDIDTSADVAEFMTILKESKPWWYVLNVDHELADVSKWCYDSIKEFLSPNVSWVDIWDIVQPMITTMLANGKVRLRPLNV